MSKITAKQAYEHASQRTNACAEILEELETIFNKIGNASKKGQSSVEVQSEYPKQMEAMLREHGYEVVINNPPFMKPSLHILWEVAKCD